MLFLRNLKIIKLHIKIKWISCQPTLSTCVCAASCNVWVTWSMYLTKFLPVAMATSPNTLIMCGFTLRWTSASRRLVRRIFIRSSQKGRIFSPMARVMSANTPTAAIQTWKFERKNILYFFIRLLLKQKDTRLNQIFNSYSSFKFASQ